MDFRQRFFPQVVFFAGVLALVFFLFSGVAGGKDRVELADGRLSVELPDGWKESELNAGDSLAGFETPDKTTSAYITEIDASTGGSMQELMDATIANFEERFDVEKVEDYKTGQVKGPVKKWPAIFTQVDAVFNRGDKEFEMRFYVMIFDTGSSLYTLQASTTRPVRDVRERQIFEFIRSVVAKS